VSVMGDYAKESTVPGGPGYVVGDKVKINAFYLAGYINMKGYADKLAEVVAVTSRLVKREDLSVQSGDRARFLEKYGLMDVYQLVDLRVKYPTGNEVFIVSPFGYDKVV
jgi:hypothetical protein